MFGEWGTISCKLTTKDIEVAKVAEVITSLVLGISPRIRPGCGSMLFPCVQVGAK